MSVKYCGPFGLRALCEKFNIRIFDRAVSLSLDGPAHTDSDVDQICELKSLQLLSLSGTQITDDGLDRIRHALPNCQIK